MAPCGYSPHDVLLVLMVYYADCSRDRAPYEKTVVYLASAKMNSVHKKANYPETPFYHVSFTENIELLFE